VSLLLHRAFAVTRSFSRSIQTSLWRQSGSIGVGRVAFPHSYRTIVVKKRYLNTLPDAKQNLTAIDQNKNNEVGDLFEREFEDIDEEEL
jgi:hypothetical protein